MKKTNRFIPSIPTPSPSLLALTLAGSAWATSPYDMPYGINWNYMIGASGDDGGSSINTALDVTSDGTVFVHNRTGISTWGSGTGGNVRGGLGAITPLGQLLYGTTVSSLPTLNSPGQQYAAGVNAVSNKAYFAVYGAQSQYWTGEDGKSANRAMVWSLDSSGLGSIAEQHSLSKYTGAAGNPLRTDSLQPITTGLTPAAGQNRIVMSDIRDSTLDMVMVMDMVAGDFGTLGDYEGYNLRTNGTQPAYLPGIGVYNFTTNTLAGPAKQPILTYGGGAATWSNMGDYRAAAIDQATGRYYGGGISHSRTESISDGWDPDGSGPAAPIPFVTSTSSANPAGIGTAYDAAHNLLYSVTWDTAGYDVISTIATTNDGSNGVFWAGEKLDDCHIELRDASGTVVWSDTFDMSPSVGVERITRVRVDANGDLFVTGYFENGGAGGGTAAYDTFVRKYKKTAANAYAVKWSMTSGLAGVQDLVSGSALDPSDQTLYTVSATWGQWTNTTGFTRTDTNNDLLVQKLTPGDFNSDGAVDFADVQLAGVATKPGLAGVDTYDFNGDGDSTLADTTHMITKIMDRLVGDIAQDTLVTDVDNADVGKAIGSTAGSGKIYLDGDMEFDGDVDNADITAVAAAFTGAKSPGKWTAGTAGATLIYRAVDGNVWISAGAATGGIITSFQLENAAGTFVPANYTGPAGGSFGGGLKDVTTNVIGDTDLTFAGVGGTPSLGTIFPAGMDQAGLEAYLTTAVYTGQPGSGQMRFNLVVGDLPSPYGSWTMGFPGLTNKDANLDFDGGGLDTGIEWVVGGDPTASGDDAGNAPALDGSDPNSFKFVFKRRDAAAADTNTKIMVEYGSDLAGWRNTADHGVIDGVTIDDSVDLGGGFHQITVSIPKSLAVDGRLFARLKVSGLPETLLNETFEAGDGGFTVVTTGGSAWQYGAPTSSDLGGGAVTAGNGGSAKCWGTNLSGGYAAGTNTKLRSPVIDLSGAASAKLSFAQALDILAPHSLVVNVLDEAGTTVLQSAVHTSTPDTNGSSAAWTPVSGVNLTGGQKIIIEWHFTGEGDGNYLGAYIDDVVVSTP